MSPITQDNLAPAKAGAIISGVLSADAKNPAAQEYVVAPYTEGRFGGNDKYYVLPKGSIDANETVLDAAIREAAEETGIDIARLLGPDNIARLRAGKPVTHVQSGYKGVRIREVVPKALDFSYDSRENKPHRAIMLHIEVEGIEHLYPHLKNPENRSSIGQIEQAPFPLRTLIRNERYPRLEVMFEWLRTMRTPKAPWAKKLAGTPLAPKPTKSGAMPAWFEVAGRPGYFAGLEAAYTEATGERIKDAPSWQNFLKQLPPEDYANILHLAELVKEKLKECKVTKGDHHIIKFDTKDLPLFFYQEGADIITKEQYLKSCIDNAANRGDFARAFAGNTRYAEEQKLPRFERILRSQIAGVVWAVGDARIDTVIDRLKKNPPKTRNGELWGQPINKCAELDRLGEDLHTVNAMMQAREVPLSDVAGIIPKGKLAHPPGHARATSAA